MMASPCSAMYVTGTSSTVYAQGPRDNYRGWSCRTGAACNAHVSVQLLCVMASPCSAMHVTWTLPTGYAQGAMHEAVLWHAEQRTAPAVDAQGPRSESLNPESGRCSAGLGVRVG